ncbi:neuroendocrine protein 7B2-like isoform X2 [Ornithodoros turicata]|uniref:neuroendocrine protein 7B2-like isoform X2 n=1 Tax=Ornithodoros turicata TaxID=34597 RepID=UPI0031392FCC
MHQEWLLCLWVVGLLSTRTHAWGEPYDRLTEGLLRQVMTRLDAAGLPEMPDEDMGTDDFVERTQHLADEDLLDRYRKEGDILGGPSIRDQEYLQHSSLWGHQYVAGGAGEGVQRLKPDGSAKNVQVVKTDAVLPAYCNPPNPCPKGYTSEDGCLEEFENSASFSREYQSAQDCMCDSEHMFDCPGATRENEIDALARSIHNQGMVSSDALGRIVDHMDAHKASPVEGQHKSVMAKKFFRKEDHERLQKQRLENEAKRWAQSSRFERNPYLQGEKLPVVAKKAPVAPRL